ncbi:MAG: hypothetical protein IT344_08910 [Candidatus Dadabacteria bacterium]|nr:hypothetical protein [Candidatus Dadabacteria bacterium]
MERLEERLDREVGAYLERVEGMDEVKALLSGEIPRESYVKFLKTFYVIEDISRRAVLKAADRTKYDVPYLSKRFLLCARGEEGHAEIALKDLAEMGVTGVDVSGATEVGEYDEFLQKAAGEFPLGVLGHSYLFENASGIMFPKHEDLPYPSKFIVVHAKEDPGHSLAIKRTVRNIESDITDEDKDRIIDFARESGERLLRVFEAMGGHSD